MSSWFVTTAVPQLGDDSPAIRLGGVHALTGLADDAPNGELRQTCIDVLCAYLVMQRQLDRLDDPTVGLTALHGDLTRSRLKILELVQGGVTGLREENREVRRRQDRMISDLSDTRDELRSTTVPLESDGALATTSYHHTAAKRADATGQAETIRIVLDDGLPYETDD